MIWRVLLLFGGLGLCFTAGEAHLWMPGAPSLPIVFGMAGGLMLGATVFLGMKPHE